MGPAARGFGWGRRIRTPATRARTWCPTPRRSPTKPTAPPTISQGSRHVQRTAVLSERLGLKRGTFAGGIEISFPVRGLRPLRAARLFTQNVPKPLIVTRRPLRNESKMALTKAFIARSAECLEDPAALAIC